MKKIESEDELIVGEFYWCRGKTKYDNGTYGEALVHGCYELCAEKYIGHNQWWAESALANWDIYGPVERPDAFTMKDEQDGDGGLVCQTCFDGEATMQDDEGDYLCSDCYRNKHHL